MKYTTLIFCLFISLANLHSQSHEFNQLYTAFRGEEGVIHVYLPGFLCRMAGNITDLDPKEQELLRSIQSIKVMVIENPEINRQVNLAKVLSRVKREQGIFPLLEVHDGESDVIILAREENKKISELYVVVGGEENAMIKIRGRMDRDLMKSLYDVTGIDQIKYAREI